MKDNLKKPLLTIVTITFNDFIGLKKTYFSLEKILNHPIEWLIKDGGSDSNILENIESFLYSLKLKNNLLENKIKFFSSKDNGIYYAMNYCLKKAKGKWLVFMNGGDEFNSSEETFNDLEVFNSEKYKLIIGSTNIVNDKNSYISKSKNINSCLGINSYRMPGMHQSQIYNEEIYKKINFKTEYKISADHVYFWEAREIINNDLLIFNYSKTIANFSNDGLSSRSGLESLKEVHKSMLKIQKVSPLISYLASMKRFVAIVSHKLRKYL